MQREIFRSPFFVVLLDESARVVRRARTPHPFESIDEVAAAYHAVVHAVDLVDRPRHSLLVDLRYGPARNDPAYESAVAPYHDPLYAGFHRVAVLVHTAAGRLQLLRVLKTARPDARVFTGEEEAEEYLSARD